MHERCRFTDSGTQHNPNCVVARGRKLSNIRQLYSGFCSRVKRAAASFRRPFITARVARRAWSRLHTFPSALRCSPKSHDSIGPYGRIRSSVASVPGRRGRSAGCFQWRVSVVVSLHRLHWTDPSLFFERRVRRKGKQANTLRRFHPNKHTCLPFQEGTCKPTRTVLHRCRQLPGREQMTPTASRMPCQVGNPNDKSCASLLGDSGAVCRS